MTESKAQRKARLAYEQRGKRPKRRQWKCELMPEDEAALETAMEKSGITGNIELLRFLIREYLDVQFWRLFCK